MGFSWDKAIKRHKIKLKLRLMNAQRKGDSEWAKFLKKRLDRLG